MTLHKDKITDKQAICLANATRSPVINVNTCIPNKATVNMIPAKVNGHGHSLQHKKGSDFKQETCHSLASGWNIQASKGALNTSNPIREIIESINLSANPKKKVIPLSIGDPTIFGNLPPCKEILDSIRRAEWSGKYYGYQTAAGLDEARQAVANYHNKSTGNRVVAKDVVLASGCSHAIDLCICVLAHPGQNILIPRPGFPLYKTLTSVYGVNYKQYNLLANSGWSIDLDHLESLIDEQTAAIVINNPSNPCGSVFDRDHLLKLLEIAERYKKPIIADEIYDKFVFLPAHYDSPSNITQKPNSDKPSSRLTPSKHNQIDTNNQPINNQFNSKLGSETDHRSICSSHNSLSASSQHNPEQNSWFISNLENQCPAPLAETSHDGLQFECDMTNECIVNSISKMNTHVPFTSISSLNTNVPVLTCGGISKTCRIPGLRLGWIIINDPIGAFELSVRPGLNRLTQRLMGPSSIVQGALRDILEKVPDSFYADTMDFIYKNATLCYERLSRMPGLEPHMPRGSMYLMVGFEATSFPDIESDLDFTSKLMNEESVLVLPGRCFDFPNYFRICLTVPFNVMTEALDRMNLFCERHYSPRSEAMHTGSKIFRY